MGLLDTPGIRRGTPSWGTPPAGDIVAVAVVRILPTVDAKLWYSDFKNQLVSAWIFSNGIAEVTSTHMMQLCVGGKLTFNLRGMPVVPKENRFFLWLQKADYEVKWWQPVTGRNGRPKVAPMPGPKVQPPRLDAA